MQSIPQHCSCFGTYMDAPAQVECCGEKYANAGVLRMTREKKRETKNHTRLLIRKKKIKIKIKIKIKETRKKKRPTRDSVARSRFQQSISDVDDGAWVWKAARTRDSNSNDRACAREPPRRRLLRTLELYGSRPPARPAKVAPRTWPFRNARPTRSCQSRRRMGEPESGMHILSHFFF